jgi:hypothetical protein
VKAALVPRVAAGRAAEDYLLFMHDAAFRAFSRVARRVSRLPTLRKYGAALPWRRVVGLWPPSPVGEVVLGGVDEVAAALAREVASRHECEDLGAHVSLAVRRAAERLEPPEWEPPRLEGRRAVKLFRGSPGAPGASPALSRIARRGRVVAAGGGVVVRAHGGLVMVSNGVDEHLLVRPGASDEEILRDIARHAGDAEALLRLLEGGLEVARAAAARGAEGAAEAAEALARAAALARLLL